MKETVITPAMKMRELRIYLVSFIVAFVLNTVGITIYRSPAIELISQLHIVLLLSSVIYLLVAVLRGLYFLISLVVKN